MPAQDVSAAKDDSHSRRVDNEIRRPAERFDMRTKPFIYVAGAYRGNIPRNVRLAVVTGGQLRDSLGIVDIVPHRSMIDDMYAPRSDQYWLDTTMDLMRGCDAVYRMAGASAGADAEVIEAIQLGIPVFFNIADLTKWAQEWKANHGSLS